MSQPPTAISITTSFFIGVLTFFYSLVLLIDLQIVLKNFDYNLTCKNCSYDLKVRKRDHFLRRTQASGKGLG